MDAEEDIFETRPNRWFGQHWGAPICEGSEPVAIPVGASCIQCTLPICEDERGLVFVNWREEAEVLASHIECFLLSVLGPVTGQEMPGERGHAYREAAVLATELRRDDAQKFKRLLEES